MAYFPDELLKCVVFVGYKDGKGNYQLAGSGFWISRPGPEDIKDIHRPAYFVTAKHVIAQIKKESSGNDIPLRNEHHVCISDLYDGQVGLALSDNQR